jgi:hypothetical protein
VGGQLSIIADNVLHKRNCFKLSTSAYALYLSCSLDRAKEMREREAALMDRWIQALQLAMPRADSTRITSIPTHCNSGATVRG